CEVCGLLPRLYKCPRCAAFSCSLACCKTHKSRSGCSGLRDRTQYVPCSALGERHLRSDFHFLEDLLQVKQRAKRTLAQSAGDTAYPKSAKALVDAARSRGTRVLLVHPGMSKRLLNTSHVADRAIHWKLESRGAGVLGAALEVHENTTLAQILEDFLAPAPENAPNRHALR
ncbi:hypothetical protein B484DRAFT_307592, partial [Ochromonadaceae sp. CCMP2298]